jgi:uncharacterized protein
LPKVEPTTVIVFAREPAPGAAKTRLIARLGAINTAALADAFVQDALAKAAALDATLVIAGSANGGANNSRYFRALARRHRATLLDQGEGTMGARMRRVIEPFAHAGAILIGTDIPSLPFTILRRSLNLLRRSPVVIGPSLDGGYYLIGVRGAMPDIFRGVRWGGARVLAQTTARLERKGLRYALAPPWYDIDRWSDLLVLGADLRRAGGGAPDPCPATREILARLGLLRSGG